MAGILVVLKKAIIEITQWMKKTKNLNITLTIIMEKIELMTSQRDETEIYLLKLYQMKLQDFVHILKKLSKTSK